MAEHKVNDGTIHDHGGASHMTKSEPRRLFRLRNLAVLATAVCAGGVGAASAAAALGVHESPQVEPGHLPSVSSGVNKNGETYGPGQEDGVSTNVDLIAAIGDNGITGFVKETDLDGDVPANLKAVEEAERLGNLPTRQQIPLYDKDGKTVLDTFTLDGTPEDYQGDQP